MIAGLVLEGDAKVGTGAFRLICDGIEPPELELEEVEVIGAPVEPLEVPSAGPGPPRRADRLRVTVGSRGSGSPAPNGGAAPELAAERDQTVRLAVEGAREELDLAPGGPARDAGVAVGLELEAHRPVGHGDVGRAHELVAPALEVLGQPQQRRHAVQALLVALDRQRARTGRARACPCGGSARPGR